MRTAIFSIILAILLVAVLTSAAAAGVPLGLPFQLKVGESQQVGSDLVIGFEKMPYDGRCAIGLVCIWEGDATCNMWARVADNDRKDFLLHTSAMFGREAVVADYLVTLIILDPYPVYEHPTDPANYVVTVVVTRRSITPVETTTWGRIKSLYSR